MHALFDGLDVDRNGRLEVAEVQAALLHLGLPAGAGYMGDLLSQYDRDKDRSITFEEFSRYVQSKESRLRAVFAAIDADGDGQLTADEVHAAAKALGLHVAPSEAERMVALLDTDADGRINLPEFRSFVVLLPGAQVSQKLIVAAWVDSASWLHSMEYRLGHMPPSQPLASRRGVRLLLGWCALEAVKV